MSGLEKKNSFVVCHVTSTHRLEDSRIFYKECLSLVEAGYSVNLVVPHPRSGIFRSVRVHGLPKNRSRLYRIFVQRWNIKRILLRIKANIYHFHDPELISLSRLIKRKLPESKIIFDAHEFTKDQIANKSWLGPVVIKRIILSTYKRYESIFIRTLDGFVAAVPEIERELPFLPSNSTTVRNVPILAMFTLGKDLVVLPEDGLPVKVIYPGTISESRGIVNLVRAMEYLPSRYKLELAGRWTDIRLREFCTTLDGWSRVKDHGQLVLEDVYRLMGECHVGIQTPLPVGNYTKGSLPIKVLEFMAAGLPAIVSDHPSKRATFGDSVLYADPEDPKCIARQIIHITDDVIRYRNYQQKGKDFVARNSWESESKKLTKLYQGVLSST